MPVFFRYKFNQVKRTKEMVVIPKTYDKILEIVLEIKALINEPLNKSHLIFTDKEEFDPKAFKDAMKSRIINKG